MDPVNESIMDAAVQELARQQLLALAARRGRPDMSIAIEAFINRCMRVSRNGEDIAALNQRQRTCIYNEWRALAFQPDNQEQQP